MSTEPETRAEKPGVEQGKMLECDIVMAGGVTSGVIYPGAVTAIAKRYHFRSIGGTSVGAIAAAFTAAAEYGRRTRKNPQSFELFASLPRGIGERQDGRSRLFRLFNAEDSTKPLMRLIEPLFGGGSTPDYLKAAILADWRITSALFVAIVAGIYLICIVAPVMPLLSIPIAATAFVALLLFAWVVSLGLLLWKWLPALSNNGFGLCTGMRDSANQLGLTRWMHQNIQALAGMENWPPLVFADLWNPGRQPDVPVNQAAPRTIDLTMIASDISRNRTTQIPFMETPTPLFVKEEVLRRYFPEEIVAWMREHSGPGIAGVAVPQGVMRLPSPEYLPVIFAARLSLSFPILLSAVPLMTPDFGARDENGLIPLRDVWYSDGGLTSNFPIHFFDSPIPSRPTFCLNLVGYNSGVAYAPHARAQAGANAKEDSERAAAQIPIAAKAVERPCSPGRTTGPRKRGAVAKRGGEPAREVNIWSLVSMNKDDSFNAVPFTDFERQGIWGFVKTLVNTARFWNDNQLSIAPGVRDRIVRIGLFNNEGGLNLDMSAETIGKLDRRGQAAGRLISARFDPSAEKDPETGLKNTNTFPNHRWIRFRNFLAGFEDMTRRFAVSRVESDEAAGRRNEGDINGLIEKELAPPVSQVTRQFYHRVTDDLETYARRLAALKLHDPNATFDGGPTPRPEDAPPAPRPKMRLVLRPLPTTDPRAETADSAPLAAANGVANAVATAGSSHETPNAASSAAGKIEVPAETG